MASNLTDSIGRLDPDFVADPAPFYERMRSRGAMTKEKGITWVLGHDMCQRLLDDGRVSSNLNPDSSPEKNAPKKRRVQTTAGNVLFADGEEHHRLRQVIRQGLSPSWNSLTVEASVEKTFSEVLTRSLKEGQLDVVADLAEPVVSSVIGRVLGMGPEESLEVTQRVSALTPLFEPFGVAQNPEQSEASRELVVYFLKNYDRLSEESPLLRRLESAKAAGEITFLEYASTPVVLFHAGLENTVNFVASGIKMVLENDFLRFTKDQALDPFMEELLRLACPAQLVVRRVTEGIPTGEAHSLGAGDLVFLILSAGNRDPSFFSNPHEVVLERDPRSHLSFGWGPHFCIGAGLARREMRSVLSELHKLSEFQISGIPQWKSQLIFRGLKELVLARS